MTCHKLKPGSQENYLFQGLTNTYIHSTKIMNTSSIVVLGNPENLMGVNDVNMFGTIGMEQISLSLGNCIIAVIFFKDSLCALADFSCVSSSYVSV